MLILSKEIDSHAHKTEKPADLYNRSAGFLLVTPVFFIGDKDIQQVAVSVPVEVVLLP